MENLNFLQNKKIIVGITASIAAYKTAILVRLLIKAGAEVQVIMTEAATEFITPLTLSTLSKKTVLLDYQKSKRTGEWNNHVELGLWADLLIIAPCSANTLAKLANGLCDNLLTAVYLSARCPVMLAPAMDLDMYVHPATARNMSILANFPQHYLIEAANGELASGLVGQGRMEEPEVIANKINEFFAKQNNTQNITQNTDLQGVNVLITAGGTREAIDPVRYISNHSTGKMGYAIAEKLAKYGAKVTLISGKVHLPTPENVTKIEAISAEDMYEAVMKNFAEQQIIIHTAAIADYTPKEKSPIKIKKNEDTLVLELVKTKDIAASVGKIRNPKQLHVGFALETNDEIAHAKGKLQKKNLDMIVLNSLQDAGAGFGHDTNKITIIDKEHTLHFELKSKQEVAEDIVRVIIEKFKKL